MLYVLLYACPVEFTKGDSAAYSTGAPCTLYMFPEMNDYDIEKIINMIEKIVEQTVKF